MIVNVRLDVTDEQRSVLSLRLHPAASKRLATRQEFTAYVAQQIEEITAVKAVDENPETLNAHAHAHARESTDGPQPIPSTPFVPITNDQIDDVVKPPYQKSIDKVCAEYKAITGLRRILFHVNNALFALSNAERRANTDTRPDIQHRLGEVSVSLGIIRQDITEEQDSECYEELDAHDPGGEA